MSMEKARSTRWAAVPHLRLALQDGQTLAGERDEQLLGALATPRAEKATVSAGHGAIVLSRDSPRT